MVSPAFSSQRQAVAVDRLAPFCLTVALLCAAFFAVPGPSSANAQLTADSVSVGARHTCAIQPSGQAVCWGQNLLGQLGDGTDDDRWRPTSVKGLANAKSISAGEKHTCAIRASGQAVCWGGNESGQLGDGTTDDRLTPTPVQGLADAAAISAGSTHSCATRTSGQAVCWGVNWNGKLGDGTTEDHLTPNPVQGLADADSISARSWHNCAIRTSGQAVCWGQNHSGELGDNSDDDSHIPTGVHGLTDAASIVVSDGNFSCATRASGQAVCWGSNTFGQLGIGTELTGSKVPTQVQGLTDAKAIAAGGDHTCAIRTSGQALCWGWNPNGQVGNGTTSFDSVLTPTAVHGLDDAKSIAAEGGNSCAIRNSGLVVCWGYNGYGQIGDGTDSDRSVPTPVLDGLSPPSARISGLAVTPKQAKVRAGKKVKLRVKVINAGDGEGKVLVKLSSSNRRVRVPAQIRVTVPAKGSITRKVTVKATGKARGRTKVTVKAAGKTARATIKVQRPRRR